MATEDNKFFSFFKFFSQIIFIALLVFIPSAVAQQETEEEALLRAQAQMNAEVLSKPFLAERPQEVDAYIEGMLKKNVTPPEYQGTYWRHGYTCRDLLRYDWTQYRNCQYYYRYYGRYY